MSKKNALQTYYQCLTTLCLVALSGITSTSIQAASLDFNIAAPTTGSLYYASDAPVNPTLTGAGIEYDVATKT